ncbi:hypothetical protein D3C85_1458060 [compost metagenome]
MRESYPRTSHNAFECKEVFECNLNAVHGDVVENKEIHENRSKQKVQLPIFADAL